MQKIRLEGDCLQYKGILKWNKILYADMLQVYLRIEEARTTIGCCPAFFETPYLMIRTQEKTYQILCDSKDKVKGYLEEIRKMNPRVIVGYKKEAQ